MSTPLEAPSEEDSGTFWDNWILDMARERAVAAEEAAEAAATQPADEDGDAEQATEHSEHEDGEEEEAGPGTEHLQDEDDSEAEQATEHPEDEDEDEAEPVFDTLEEWVHFYFLPLFRRVEGGENKWCRTWWKHTEAIARLDALWRAWESLRLDEQTGMSTWFRDHADHHVPLLMSQNGPFRQCKGETHRETAQLESEWAPDGWWDGEDGDWDE